MPFNIDISAIFKEAFGLDVPPFEIQNKNVPGAQYGTKMGSPLRAQDANGRWYFLPVKLGGLQLSYPIIRIMGRKNIVSTPLVARRGSVKELVNIDDYYISIMGIMVGDRRSPASVWPEEQVDQLRELYERNESLILENALTDLFLVQPGTGGRDSVIITNMEIPEIRGSENVVAYRLELLSDQVLVLTAD